MSTSHPDVSTNAGLEELFHEEALPPLPHKRGEPIFRDSWEAEVYAIGNLLVKEGHILPAEWMKCMADAIARAQAEGDPDSGDTYYRHWCAALETVCFEKDWTTPDLYQQQLTLWAIAIANTPHGVPLSLENAFRSDVDIAHVGYHGHSHSHTHTHTHTHSHGPEAAPPPQYWTPIHRSRLKPATPEV
jgi:nitrile hydratase accessory protein